MNAFCVFKPKDYEGLVTYLRAIQEVFKLDGVTMVFVSPTSDTRADKQTDAKVVGTAQRKLTTKTQKRVRQPRRVKAPINNDVEKPHTVTVGWRESIMNWLKGTGWYLTVRAWADAIINKFFS